MVHSVKNRKKKIPALPGTMALLRDTADVEAFNGSDAMLSVRGSIEQATAAAPLKAIFTVHTAGGMVWTRTFTIPLSLN